MSRDVQPPALAALEPDVRAIADVEAFGLVSAHDEDGSLELFTRHRVGTAGHRMPKRMVPQLLRPGRVGPPADAQVTTFADPEAVFAGRLRSHGIGRVLAVGVRGGAGLFWIGRAGEAELGADQVAAVAALARRASEAGEPSPAARL